jgi:hypothetical protein
MYRNIEIGGIDYHTELGILIDHRITIKDGNVSVSADLDGRTPGAIFEATFTGRGETRVLVAPEEYTIGDAVMAAGDDVKIAKAAKLAEIAKARYLEEMGGLDVGAFHLATDDRSKALLSGAYNKARANSAFTTKWKDAEGAFHAVDAETVIAAYDAMTDWVETLFAREAELVATVKAATTVGDAQAVIWSPA